MRQNGSSVFSATKVVCSNLSGGFDLDIESDLITNSIALDAGRYPF